MRAILRKQIHSCFAAVSSSDVFLEMEADIPFLPQAEMKFMFGQGEDQLEDEVQVVYWNVDLRVLTVYMEEDKEFYERALRGNSVLGPHASKDEMDAKVKEYMKAGWRLKSSSV